MASPNILFLVICIQFSTIFSRNSDTKWPHLDVNPRAGVFDHPESSYPTAWLERSTRSDSELRNQLISKVANKMGISSRLLMEKLKTLTSDGGKNDILALKDAFIGSRG